MKKYVYNIIRLFVLWPIYGLSKLIPKNERLYCFGAPRDRFVDNSKYLFLFLNTYYPHLKCVWVSGDKKLINEMRAQGYRVVDRNSWQGILTILRAQFVFYSCFISEVSFWLTGGAKAFNLWHGMPLKKIEFDIDSGPLVNKYSDRFSWNKLGWQLFNPVSFRRPDFMFAPTELFECIFKRCFRMKGGHVIRCGSPRTDIFFEAENKISLGNSYLELKSDKKQGKKVYLYMPTFRDTGGDFFSDAKFDFHKLNEKMNQDNAIFYIKVHPNAGLDSFNQTSFAAIKVIPSDVDPYPLLSDVDVLITDYSSIYIDYLLIDKPILFFAFDLASYLSTCRDMYFEYEEVTPGKIVQNFDDMLVALGANDTYAEARKALKEKFWGEEYVMGFQKIAESLMAVSDE